MGFLGGLFETKASKPVSHAISASPSARGGMFSVGIGGSWDTESAINNAYERVMFVYRCVDTIATNQAALPILLRKGDAKHGTILSNPNLFKLFNIRPNSYETAFSFRYRMSSLALLSRRGIFVEVEGDLNNPEALHLLPPNMCEPIPHPTKFVSGYKVRTAQGEEETIPAERIIWIRTKPHPLDTYAQMTPLVAAGLAVETDFLARMFNRNFLMNDGRPGLLVTVKGTMIREDAQELKRRFSGGVHTAGQTTVIEGDGLDIADLSATPRDVQWLEAIGGSKEDILLAFGVPESVMGNASGRTFDNADAEREGFWKDTMVPHCDSLGNGFDVLTGQLDDETQLAYDYSVVDVLQRQEEARQAKVLGEWQAGKITWNEMRERTGEEIWDNPLAARIIVLPSGIAMAEEDADTAAITKLPIVGATPPAEQMGMLGQQFGTGRQAALSEASRQGALAGTRAGAKEFDNVISARTFNLRRQAAELARKDDDPDALEVKDDSTDNHTDDEVIDAYVISPYEESRAEMEVVAESLLLNMSNRQEKVIPDRMDHAKARKGTRHWEGETKVVRNIDPDYVVQTERWSADMRDDFDKAIRPLLEREANRTAVELEESGILDKMVQAGTVTGEGKTALDRVLNNTAQDKDNIVNTSLNAVLDVVETSVRNQSKRVSDLVRRMDEDGKSLKQIQEAVRSQIGTRSEWRKSLATAMTTAAVEGVRNSVYSKAGARIKKTWNTSSDERVRTTHKLLEGKSVLASTAFTVGGAKMQYPGDPTGPVHEVANCRCWLTYSY